MPKPIQQYRVFIASPGGLEAERTCFRDRLRRFSNLHGDDRGALFHPVGWEDTVGGVGRPQALINADLEQCDYAVFVLHDRWGTPPGSGATSGTDEEWKLAEELYKANKIRNIALFFKNVDARRLRDPGPQLQAVLAFKKQIEEGKRYLFNEYEGIDRFDEVLEGHLAKWLKDHEAEPPEFATQGPTAGGSVLETATNSPSSAASPPFPYWLLEAANSLQGNDPDYAGALFCANKAIKLASSVNEWANARNLSGVIQAHLGKLNEAMTAFEEIADKCSTSMDINSQEYVAGALFNKGVTFGILGRNEEAIAVHDDVLARFGTATELPLRRQVAKALVSRGFRLGILGRRDEEIAAYDDVLARFGTAAELPLREQVARALVNKGGVLSTLGRNEEEIAVYNDVLARFGTATELPLREQVARALVNKGVVLGTLGRSDEEIAVYDDALARFGTATELPFREQVANALVNKGVVLGTMGRSDEEISAYGDVLARFGTATELPLIGAVAKALVNKGIELGTLGHSVEAIAVYDDVLARFGTATELPLREEVAKALVNKGVELGILGHTEEGIAACDDVLARFGTATEPPLVEAVARAKGLRDRLRKP